MKVERLKRAGTDDDDDRSETGSVLEVCSFMGSVGVLDGLGWHRTGVTGWDGISWRRTSESENYFKGGLVVTCHSSLVCFLSMAYKSYFFVIDVACCRALGEG